MLDYVTWAVEKTKLTVVEALRLVGLARRTAFDWLRRARRGTALKPRGRKPSQGTVAERNAVIAFLREQGPQTGLPTLRAQFPKRARRELRDLLRRYKRLCRKRWRVYAESLVWREAGSVWAMDFTKLPSLPLEGELTHALVVRDLASGKILETLPARAEDAITTCGVLAALIARYGPPLVLKCDNGSAFIADAARDLLEDHEVAVLYSPPRTPEYNGACEAGMGWLKTHAHYHAARHGRPGAWTADDLEAARLRANELGRPRGAKGPTPDQAWEARKPINELEREVFRLTWQRRQRDARHELGFDLDADLSRAEQAQVDRKSLRRALVEHGLLWIERGWIPLRKKR